MPLTEQPSYYYRPPVTDEVPLVYATNTLEVSHQQVHVVPGAVIA